MITTAASPDRPGPAPTDTRPTWVLGASTLGAPGEDLDAVVATLTRHGAQVVELRAAPDALVHTGLSPAGRATVRERLDAAGIAVLAVATGVRVAADVPEPDMLAALEAHLQLSADLGATFMRVFPGAPARPAARDELPTLLEDREAADDRAVRRLAAISDTATRLDVRPVLETHDSHPRGEDVARVLALLERRHPGHPVGTIWDALHPWRVGEAPERTAEHLLPHLTNGRGYVQIKDVQAPSDTTPRLQGTGSVPVPQVLDLLACGGYTGPISLEWERTWHPRIESLDDALGAAAAVVGAWGATHR